MTAFALKIVACVCMLIDHIGAVFPYDTPPWFRWVGRIAFPLYAYMIAQGFKYTKNAGKYLARLGLFALISEIPFDVAFISPKITNGALSLNINFLRDTNVFYSLFLGAACIAVYERLSRRGDSPPTLPRRLVALLPAAPIIILGAVLGIDYGMYAIIYILFFYFMRPESRATRTAAMAIVVFVEYGYQCVFYWLRDLGVMPPLLPGKMMVNSMYNGAFFGFAMVAVALVYLYNGKRGRKAKWAFYWFYPAHIAALAAVWFVVNRGGFG